MDTAKKTARRIGNHGNAAPVATPGKPANAGYAEPQPGKRDADAQPDPKVPGNRAAQVAASAHPRGPAKPGDPEEPAMPDTGDDAPPGEHKREPIEDPDPAETTLQVQRRTR